MGISELQLEKARVGEIISSSGLCSQCIGIAPPVCRGQGWDPKLADVIFPLEGGPKKQTHSWNVKRKRNIVGRLSKGLERIIPTKGKPDEKSIMKFPGVNYSLKSN